MLAEVVAPTVRCVETRALVRRGAALGGLRLSLRYVLAGAAALPCAEGGSLSAAPLHPAPDDNFKVIT